MFSNEKEFLSTIRKNKRTNILKAPLTIHKRDTSQKSKRVFMESAGMSQTLTLCCNKDDDLKEMLC